MKILIVSNTIHAGGAETFVLRLARKLKQIGVAADILCLNPDLEDEALIAQFPELTIYRAAPPALRWMKRLDRVIKMLGIDYSVQYALTRSIIERQGLLRYDVYHTHLIPADLSFALLKRKHPSMRIVSTLHGDYIEFDELWDANKAKKHPNWPQKTEIVKKGVDKWVYISDLQRERFVQRYGVPAITMEKIYNGYELPALLAAPRPHPETGGLVFIMVSRMIEGKGWEYLIRAFMKLQGPHELVLVGKGEALEKFKLLAQPDKRIRFMGFHPNPSEFIQEADVFVFPSVLVEESLPTVVIEALYCGKPVIASEVGEIKTMITVPQTGEVAGMLVNPRDKANLVDALVEAMNKYINDRALLRAHGALTKGAFEKFDMETCARRYLKVFEDVCRG